MIKSVLGQGGLANNGVPQSTQFIAENFLAKLNVLVPNAVVEDWVI